MPYPYNGFGYFNPTGKQQLAMGIGSLLAAGLAAAQPRQAGDASPLLRGIEGGLAGYGNAYKNYQDMAGDNYSRNMAANQFDQRIKDDEERRSMQKESLGIEKQKLREQILPESRAKVQAYDKYGYFGKPPNSIIENEYANRLTPEEKTGFDKYASPATVPILAERAARGEKLAKDALAQVNMPRVTTTDQGVMLVNPRTGDIKDTGLTQKPEISNAEISQIGKLNTLKQVGGDLGKLMETVSMGPAVGRLEQLKSEWTSGLSNEDQLNFQTLNQQLFNTLGELRSGKVITENEYKRLNAEIPRSNLGYKAYKVRLENYNKYLDREIDNKLNAYKQGNYNVRGFEQGGEGISAAGKELTTEEAVKYMQKAGGDRKKAEDMARKDGWNF